MPELKNRQWELFARAYIATWGNARQSAIDAGNSIGNADKQGTIVASKPAVRARIAELAVDYDADGIATMEAARSLVYKTLTDLAQTSSSPQARVQAARTLGDFLMLGDAGIRARAAQDKSDLDRQRLEIQRQAIDLAKDDKNVRISLDFKTGKIYTAEVDEKAPSSGEKNISS